MLFSLEDVIQVSLAVFFAYDRIASRSHFWDATVDAKAMACSGDCCCNVVDSAANVPMLTMMH